MKKKTTLLTVALTSFALTNMVQAQDDGNGIAASAGLDATSAYIFRGATVNDEINVNPYLEASLNGFTAGTWGNFNTDTEQVDEVDYYLSYDLPLESSPVGVTVGYTEYTYPTQNGSTSTTAEDGTVTATSTGAIDADREIFVSFSTGDDIPGSPSLGVYYGIEGPFLDESIYLELGAGHSVDLTEDNALDLGIAIGYEAGDQVVDNGFSHVTLSAGTGIGPASISLNYVIETDDKVLAVDEEFFISVGVGL